MDKLLNISTIGLTPLTNEELISYEGGSDASKELGRKHGEAVREFLDNIGLVTLIVVIATRGRVRL